MKYMGSKKRHSREIAGLITPWLKLMGGAYVEPFVGGANMLEKISGKRIAGDVDADLITLWREVSIGWLPPVNLTEQDYARMKAQSYPSALKGYCKFSLSFGGLAWGGWRKDSIGIRDYVAESYRGMVKQAPLLRGVDFHLCSYLDLDIPFGSVVYCDPPYEGTTGYQNSFDHSVFWQWCRDVSFHSKVFISEYSAPSDFSAIWEKDVPSSLVSKGAVKRNIEKLFIYGNT
jgi:DNA adenine methylase